MAEKTISKKRNTPTKKRSQSCYQRKVDKITKWYNHIVKNRQEKNAKRIEKKPLKELEYFIKQIKEPRGDK